MAEKIIHLRASGVSVVLDTTGGGLPRVLHWGASLGEVDSAELAAVARLLGRPVPTAGPDGPVPLALLPEHSAAYPGRPGLRGHRDGADWTASFTLTGVDRTDPRSVSAHAEDEHARLALTSTLELAPSGVLRVRHELRNTGDCPYTVDGLEVALPIPAQATELLDFTGRHCRERHPQRHPLAFGTWLRENRRGRTGLDATIGLLAGTAGFGFRHGEIWALHVAWSGNHVTYAERIPDGMAALGGGELLMPGEIVLAPGESHVTPWVIAAYSATGIDGLSARFHGFLRARPHHPHRPRPVTLNTWEAVYFDHDLGRLRALADTAAGLGVERFVLDDGWFSGRRDDRAGLGDWQVDPQVWPDGLHPLVDHVRGLGMQFGLWVEPEMVNPDSELFRAHPDWLLAPPHRPPPLARQQYVLDVAHPDAQRHLLSRLDALVTEYRIDYLKWDHNRDLVDAQHAGRAGYHAQITAVYRLLDELRSRHPDLEIESCSSGGGRVDLAILDHTDRIWTSDCNDALERQAIQRWTGVFLPPELLGTHVGPDRAHTTSRTHDLDFRAVTALFGHFGIEWDITTADPAQRDALAAAIAWYQRHRDLLHTGEAVRVDHPDPAAWLHGVVATDRSRAVFCYVQLATSAAAAPPPLRLPGLDPDRRYRVRPVHPAGEPVLGGRTVPPWYLGPPVEATGRTLCTVGLQPPILHPEHALLLSVD